MTKNQFRAIVAASIALLVLTVIAMFTLAPPLPAELDRWMTQQAEAELTVFEWVTIALLLPWLAANIGLFFFVRWSRALYAITTGALTVSTLFTGPGVSTALELFANDVTQLLDGLIIGLAYFSDARHHFEPHAQPTAA